MVTIKSLSGRKFKSKNGQTAISFVIENEDGSSISNEAKLDESGLALNGKSRATSKCND